MPLDEAQTRALLHWLGTEGGLEPTSLEMLKGVAATERAPLEDVVLTLGLVEERSLLAIVAELLGLPFTDALAREHLEAALLDEFGVAFFTTRGVAPLRDKDGTLRLATAKPTDVAALQEIAFVLNRSFTPAVAPSASIRAVLRGQGEEDEAAGSTTSLAESSTAQAVRKRFQNAAQGGTVARQIEAIVADAIGLGASDIHLEATQHGARVRLRLNGVLQPYELPPGFDAGAALARLKTLAGMNVTERRLPQDGRATIVFEGRTVELRLSSIPVQHGESIVARVLDPKALRRGWDALGFPPEIVRDLKTILERPSGLFVISGPTGSGKTTTLYTMLSHLNDGRRKILSVEDPVEYALDGIEQVQVNAAIGLTFAAVLRAALRQDPDVLMIGEIRDNETAEIACRAALIGRLVLATIHASSANTVKTRLVNLAVPNFLVDDVLIGVLQQQLEPAENQPRDGDNNNSTHLERTAPSNSAPSKYNQPASVRRVKAALTKLEPIHP